FHIIHPDFHIIHPDFHIIHLAFCNSHHHALPTSPSTIIQSIPHSTCTSATPSRRGWHHHTRWFSTLHCLHYTRRNNRCRDLTTTLSDTDWGTTDWGDTDTTKGLTDTDSNGTETLGFPGTTSANPDSSLFRRKNSSTNSDLLCKASGHRL
ncbi:hypothetical protein AB205_0192930, partial [Aquarana catesbeiana]